jgi:hypothetical protein
MVHEEEEEEEGKRRMGDGRDGTKREEWKSHLESRLG